MPPVEPDLITRLGFELPAPVEAVGVLLRLVLAAALGGVLGLERARRGKAAGVRTHMLVGLGSALFVIVAREAGASPADLTRVIQGIATGIGFVGAGAILKRGDRSVRGLTTAAGIWLTAGVGIGVGVGRLWVPTVAVLLALPILAFLQQLETGPGTPGSTSGSSRP